MRLKIFILFLFISAGAQAQTAYADSLITLLDKSNKDFVIQLPIKNYK